MTYPRAHLVDTKNGGYYHCTSRCVRRAWLCGNDPYTKKSYSHRKLWLERRITLLAKIFAIDLFAYAVMSNHYHLVVRLDPKRTKSWGAAEIARRWIERRSGIPAKQRRVLAEELANNPKRLALARERLGSLSWFMRCINEPLARIANAEDDCSGRFWEGRFKSVVLLDKSALVNCMVYVDLNPGRANKT